MGETVDAAATSAERRLMDALFDEGGKREPAAAARAVAVDGCRHDFVTGALHDRRLVATPIPPSDDLMFQVAARFLSRTEGAQHAALRRAFTGLFSPRRIEAYRADVARTADQLLDAFPAAGPVDAVASFARPLPYAVICRVLGVPDDEQPWLAERMDAFGRAVAGQRERSAVEAGNTATAEMLDRFAVLLEERREHPTGDVLSLLATSAAADELHDALLANCIFFVMAGHATTTALLAAGVHLLSTHPDQLQLVRTGRASWSDVVDELLRLVSPTTLTGVTATIDVEVAGRLVPAGHTRAVVYAAANRDPDVFEHPDRFDATRGPNPHVAFSAGAHYCLGAPLARLHGEVALDLLFTRYPQLRATEEPRWIGSVPIRQVAGLTVSWDAAPTA